MFFEGSEKKAEILIDSQQLSLLDLPDQFWSAMVEQCRAQILSTLSNDCCKAFLLSESSLFVWSDRLLILTCGETRLAQAVEYFLNHVDHKAILQLIYQRKNELISSAQASHFFDDAKRLNALIAGKAYRFGELFDHHNFLFHIDNDYQAQQGDQTYELLAYQISAQASEHLTTPGLKAADIRQFLRLDELIPDFLIDDFVFEPFGYSLNALKGDKYLTIHVTPQATSSYVSFESNLDLIAKAPLILAVLAPVSLDLVSFNESLFADRTAQFIPDDYVRKSLVQDRLNNGFQVCFSSYILPQSQSVKPLPLDF